jgi:hypothetical protein
MTEGNRIRPRSIRWAQRHWLAFDVMVIHPESGIQIRKRTRNLNLYGCGVSAASPFSAGTRVVLKMAYGQEKIAAPGKVVYGRPDIGMGIVFTNIEPKDQIIIEDWIADILSRSDRQIDPNE